MNSSLAFYHTVRVKGNSDANGLVDNLMLMTTGLARTRQISACLFEIMFYVSR